MPVYIDQTGHKVQLDSSPQRIISLVPSQTEFLHHIGLGDRIVGVSKFCVHPKPWSSKVKKVGGTKDLKHDVIAELEPDLIIGNKEENTQDDIERLRNEHPVWVTEVNSITDALSMFQNLGKLLGAQREADQLSRDVKLGFSGLKRFYGQKMAYLIWNEPMMTVGNDTYINDVLRVIGLKNAFAGRVRYPEVSWEQLADQRLEFLFLSSEPFPFSKKHIKAFQKRLPNTKIVLVDGEMFSWYGNRMLEALDYFADLKNRLSKR